MFANLLTQRKCFLLTWLGGGLSGLSNRAKKCPHLPQTILPRRNVDGNVPLVCGNLKFAKVLPI